MDLCFASTEVTNMGQKGRITSPSLSIQQQASIHKGVFVTCWGGIPPNPPQHPRLRKQVSTSTGATGKSGAIGGESYQEAQQGVPVAEASLSASPWHSPTALFGGG